MPGRTSVRLIAAAAAIVLSAAIALITAALALEDLRGAFVRLVAAVAGLPLACIVLTIAQQARGSATSMAPRPLSTAGYLVAGGLSVLFLPFGYLSAYAALLLLSLAVLFTCVAWVRPGEERIIETCTLGTALIVLTMWFLFRVDDSLPLALLSGGGISGVLAGLYALRRRGNARIP